jgi:hypothetical protein
MKRCSKGKSCGGTCISRVKVCLKGLGANADSSVGRLREKLKPSKVSEEWFKEGAFKAFKKPAKEPFEVAQKAGTIQTLEGPVKYGKGFYIITGPKGEKYPIPPETFAKLKVDNGDGTASPKKIVKLAKEADHSGEVKTSWGETLKYKPGEDVIVRHGDGDYGVVKRGIFEETYQREG